MKKRILSALSVLALVAMLLSLPIVTFAEGKQVLISASAETELFYEDHTGKKLADLTAGNSTEKRDGLSPLNNLYDQTVVGSGTTDFSKQFEVVSKKLDIMGNHASETTSKNVFSMSNDKNPNAGEGFLTVVPASVLAGLDQFTVSYLERQYAPNGAFGLALFYQSKTTDGVSYFNGYDNFTFTGFTGTKLSDYSTWTVAGGEKTAFESAALTTGHKPKKNCSVYVSVSCTKGSWEVDGKTYTAKIESFVDDIPVSVSYAQWADAPVMFYYQSTADKRWDVQFTNLRVTTKTGTLMPADEALQILRPLSVTGSAVRWSGGAGLRFYTALKAVPEASAAEVGVILQESSAYTGELTLETPGILRSAAPRTVSDADGILRQSHAFVDSAALEGKTFIARAYVTFTIEDTPFVYYAEPEKASCRRTAAKVVAGIGETRSNAEMLAACREIAGDITALDVMSFNVLNAASYEAGEFGTLTDEVRTASAVEMFLSLMPDVIGLQEVSDRILAMYRANGELMKHYELTGSPVGENGEEGLFILWRKDRFDLVASGTKWLSDTPDTPNSLFEEAVEANRQGASFYPRKAVWAVLSEKTTGNRFAFCDTHFSYKGQVAELESVGSTLRRKQAEKLAELIASDAMFDHTLPFFIVGDFNDKANSPAYTALTSVASDIRYEADSAPAFNQGTHHGYEGKKVFLDYIFAGTGTFYISQMDIVTETFRDILPSAHYALTGAVTILPD